jgi:hypothetical protein
MDLLLLLLHSISISTWLGRFEGIGTVVGRRSNKGSIMFSNSSADCRDLPLWPKRARVVGDSRYQLRTL